MAETGDPKDPSPARPDPDDLVGFASPSALEGRVRSPAPDPAPPAEPSPQPEPELFDAAPGVTPAAEPVADLGPSFGERPDDTPPATLVAPTPAWARETPPEPAPPQEPVGLGLYAVYALILFAVPTLGVSALVGLLAVTGRALPEAPLARSHFLFQQRTLWAAGVAALLGAILIVINLGVFVLFLLAIWTLVRGAVGVLRLKAGRPIDNPLTWLI